MWLRHAVHASPKFDVWPQMTLNVRSFCSCFCLCTAEIIGRSHHAWVCEVLGVEPRASPVLGKHCTNWALSPAPLHTSSLVLACGLCLQQCLLPSLCMLRTLLLWLCCAYCWQFVFPGHDGVWIAVLPNATAPCCFLAGGCWVAAKLHLWKGML